MHMSQQRIIPRWKNWVHLATQQFRLRKLIRIIAVNVGTEDLSGNFRKGTSDSEHCAPTLYYYTLHATAMSSPFYTSEKLESSCPKWKEIEENTWSKNGVFSGTEAFVLRLWCHSPVIGNDEVITVWGVHLSGLILLGQHLSIGKPSFKPNTVIFLLPGGYYTHPDYVVHGEKERHVSVTVVNEDVRHSYSVNMLTKSHTLHRKIVQKTNEAEQMRQKIASGVYITSDSRGSATLRRILNRTKSKSNHLDLDKIKKCVEFERFRVQTLREEKAKLAERIKRKKELIEALCDRNGMLESKIMEMYRLLQRDVLSHREWLKKHIEQREAHLHSRALLTFRTKQLISELNCIYPVENNGDKFTICGVNLPDSESFAGQDDLRLSVGLGFVAHSVQMISVFLQVPLRYPIVHFGSRSRIIDNIADKIPDREREFPLFCKGQDKLQFNYAVYLLNKNIAQLRCGCDLATHDLRCTLANLASLLRVGAMEGQQELPFHSPSSSTLDLVSSFSISSPIESAFSPRRAPARTQRVSESMVVTSRPETFTTVGHRVTKSVGSAADFKLAPAPMPPVETQQIVVPLANNLSYSLDKGLDEFKEIKRIDGGSDTLEVPVPYSLGGSETSLPACLSRRNSSKEPTCLVEETSTSTYLKNWEATKSNVIFSDDDSDLNSSGNFAEKTVINETTVEVCVDTPVRIIEADRVSLGMEVCDDASHENGEVCETLQNGETTPSSDSLMANVTDRTEVLASNSSSFNMFRSRFRTNLGSTN